MRKVILVVLAICLLICCTSFKTRVEQVEETDMVEPISITDVAAAVSLTQGAGILIEKVVIPEIQLSELPELVTQNRVCLDLNWVKEHLDQYYTDEEIRLTTLIVQAEDLIAHSDTIWSAHVWVILGRVGAPGFDANSILEVLSAPGQFSTWCTKCLSVEPVPEVEAIVRDVFARKILEDMGEPEWVVGRTVPATHLFFDNRNGDLYNEFYRYCWGDVYDPFSSPYNPYLT